MLRIVKALAFMAMGLPGLAHADGNRVVVELFTAQGCSSCPPADALLARLADDPKILSLALHVDYWDYLGWKDAFASPAFTQRQKAYAQAAQERMIFTPQVIVNGQHSEIGSDAAAVMAAVMHLMNDKALVDLKVKRQGNQVVVEAKALSPLEGSFDVVLVRFVPEQSVEIQHGENAGLTVRYVNIVTSLSVLGRWDGTQAIQLVAQVPGNEGSAVLVQRANAGAILAAAELP